MGGGGGVPGGESGRGVERGEGGDKEESLRGEGGVTRTSKYEREGVTTEEGGTAGCEGTTRVGGLAPLVGLTRRAFEIGGGEAKGTGGSKAAAETQEDSCSRGSGEMSPTFLGTFLRHVFRGSFGGKLSDFSATFSSLLLVLVVTATFFLADFSAPLPLEFWRLPCGCSFSGRFLAGTFLAGRFPERKYKLLFVVIGGAQFGRGEGADLLNEFPVSVFIFEFVLVSDFDLDLGLGLDRVIPSSSSLINISDFLIFFKRDK